MKEDEKALWENKRVTPPASAPSSPAKANCSKQSRWGTVAPKGGLYRGEGGGLRWGGGVTDGWKRC